jgi:ribonuclease HII
VGEASVEEIESLNILGAARLAMKRAVKSLSVRPEIVLVDGLPRLEREKEGQLGNDSWSAEFIVGGDKLSFSIAAASILAKVYRDEMMIKLADQYPDYGWESNKGYGSLKHRLALKEMGVTRHHRKTYAPVAKCLT